MAISKVILNGDTLMDVTSDTVEAGKLLSGETATKNDGTRISGSVPLASAQTIIPTESIQTAVPSGYYTTGPISIGAISSSYIGSAIPMRTSSDIKYFGNGTIVASSGYYSKQGVYSFPEANVSYYGGIISSTGKFSYGYTTIDDGYVYSGKGAGATTQLPTLSAQTYIPGSTSQIISLYQWLTGTQTIEAIPSAYVIPSGTYSISSNGTYDVGSYKSTTVAIEPTYTATITNGNDANSYTYVTYNNRTHKSTGSIFDFKPSEKLQIHIYPYSTVGTNTLYINGEIAEAHSDNTVIDYEYTLPSNNINISMHYAAYDHEYIHIFESIIPSGTLSITSNASYNVYGYSTVSVNATGEYYGIYKALAKGENINTRGDTYGYGYTSQEVQDYCDSLTYIYNNQFVQRDFVPSGTIFNNVSTIGTHAFGSVRDNTISGNYRGSLTYSFPSLSSIDSEAFIYNNFIKEINAPNCSIIKEKAFRECNFLNTINFPACVLIGSYAFYNCFSLTSASFPVCTSIGSNAFYSCSALTSASFPVCTSIGSTAFYNCSALTSASFPVCTSIGDYAFAGCNSLTDLSFPNCVSIGTYAFSNCTKIITADFPVCTTIGSYAFSRCLSLTTISFPVCTTIGSYAFSRCCNLLSVYLLGSSIPSLVNVNAFVSTPISNYTTSTGGVYGSIYVPASLYNSYIIATNWSTYSARIVGMSWNQLINETVTVTTMGLRGAVLSTTTSLENIKTAKITINNIEYICSQYIDNENNVPIYRYGAQQNGYDEESLPIMDWSIYPFEIYNYNTGNNYVTILIVDSNKFAENESVVVKIEEQVNSLP